MKTPPERTHNTFSFFAIVVWIWSTILLLATVTFDTPDSERMFRIGLWANLFAGYSMFQVIFLNLLDNKRKSEKED